MRLKSILQIWSASCTQLGSKANFQYHRSLQFSLSAFCLCRCQSSDANSHCLESLWAAEKDFTRGWREVQCSSIPFNDATFIRCLNGLSANPNFQMTFFLVAIKTLLLKQPQSKWLRWRAQKKLINYLNILKKWKMR